MNAIEFEFEQIRHACETLQEHIERLITSNQKAEALLCETLYFLADKPKTKEIETLIKKIEELIEI